MPCTAGTFYTHYISKLVSEKTWILPETNPFSVKNLDKKYFVPYSINTSLYLCGRRHFDLYLQNYKKELNNFIREFIDSNSDCLLIRDQLFSQFANKRYKDHQNLFIAKCLEELNLDFKIIFTVRDPIDSWIAMNANFPRTNMDLNDYLTIYQSALNTYEKKYKSKLLKIKIEDFYLELENIRKLIDNFLGIKTFLNKKIRVSNNELTSGASGRRSEVPKLFPFKPFSYFAYKEIISNKKFLNFRSKLGYKDEFKFKNKIDFLFSLLHCIYQPIIHFKFNKDRKIAYYLKSNKLAFR